MYGAYLRKSRADLDLENNTGIDTLQRHRDLIIQTAKNQNITISKWFEEVVSGETIEARPKVQELLLEVEQGFYDGILVVDVDRLARGDTADQSRISKAFSFSSTKIITPNKTYDPNNEFDEEFFEFGLFMSRREYKIINRRLNRGRIASVNEGKYIGSITPYGYDKEKIKGQKGFKLIINPDEEKVVKIIFKLACDGVGASNIANQINNLGIKPRKTDVWVSATIRSIIQNPVYYGMIKWGHRKTEKRMINGIVYKSRPKHSDYILVQGLHDPIITKEEYDLANKNSKIKTGKSTPKTLKLENPLAGLVKCSYCGRTMVRRNYRSGHIDGLICPLPHCKNIGSHLYLVEDRIKDSLKLILKEYKNLIKNNSNNTVTEVENDNLEIINNELEKLNKQLDKAYDMLEQEIYDSDTFIKRSNIIKNKIELLKQEKTKYNPKNKKNHIQKIENMIPNIERCLNEYNDNLSAQEKNDLLKGIINDIIYIKHKKGKGHEDEFHLKINVNLDI